MDPETEVENPQPPELAHGFENYDINEIYKKTQEYALGWHAKNFIVDFGKANSRVRRNISPEDFKEIFEDGDARTDAPVRWINLWGPNAQTKIVKVIGERYGFSPRLIELLRTAPPRDPKSKTPSEVRDGKEGSTSESETPDHLAPVNEVLNAANAVGQTNFYKIAADFTNYQSFDIGDHFICIGANWMHPMFKKDPTTTKLEDMQGDRLWAWLILCDDATVISIHEDPTKEDMDEEYTQKVRTHTLTVLSQLSKINAGKTGGVSLISLREPMRDDGTIADASEAASNLFYYLFDDWPSTVELLKDFKIQLHVLKRAIISGLNPRLPTVPADQIIPGLYEIGKLLRKNHHLYEGYKTLIDRILDHKAQPQHPSLLSSPSFTSNTASTAHAASSKKIAVSHQACDRFERLRHHIRLLVLNYLSEAIEEKDSLMSMYFSITNAKDSAATAKLSSDAALLSKLGVLFLPVSLMTSYFSTQISELNGVYTAKTYWVTFAVIMVLSFLALFLFSSLLQGVAKLGKIKLGVGKDRLREMLTPRRLRQGGTGAGVGGAGGMEMVGLKV